MGCSDENTNPAMAPANFNDAQFQMLPDQGEFGDNKGFSSNMMGGGMMNGGTIGAGGCGGNTVGDESIPLTIDEAIKAANKYLEAINNPDLALAEVMEFANNFYAEVYEKSTGISAFEILINRYTGNVYPEPGPNMMWNTKYGHTSLRGTGRMHNAVSNRKTVTQMTVTDAQALEIAQKFLDRNLPGIKVAEEADTFYGYYTIHVLRDNEIYGILSVNGYNSQVWYHNWHGDFIGMKELD